MKDWIFQAAAAVPDALWERIAETRCLMPYYHMVSDEYVPHVSPLYSFRDPKTFEQDLDYFLRRRRAISIQEFLGAIQSTGQPPENTFLLTFDDGFREMHDVALPILTRKGVPAVFFINSASCDNQELCHHQKLSLLIDRASHCGAQAQAEAAKKLSTAGYVGSDLVAALKTVPWKEKNLTTQLGQLLSVDFGAYLKTKKPYLCFAEIKKMLAAGMYIGGHSIDHPLYANISLDEQLRQTRESVRFVVERFDLQHKTFAFPHTDRGVGRAYFDALQREGIVDVSFGTAAPFDDCVPRNFQRFTMEKTARPPAAIVARNRLRRFRMNVTGKKTLARA